MKFKIQRSEFHRKLSDIQGIAAVKTTIPITSHFLLQTGKEGSSITATDMEITFREGLSAEVEEEGALCLPSKKLYDIVHELEDGEITVESEKDSYIKLKA